MFGFASSICVKYVTSLSSRFYDWQFFVYEILSLGPASAANSVSPHHKCIYFVVCTTNVGEINETLSFYFHVVDRSCSMCEIAKVWHKHFWGWVWPRVNSFSGGLLSARRLSTWLAPFVCKWIYVVWGIVRGGWVVGGLQVIALIVMILRADKSKNT